MGTMIVKMKVMPSSPSDDLKKIENEIKLVLEKESCQRISFAQEPVAFGLKAIIASFYMDEKKDLEPIEEKIQKIKEVNSTQILEMSRGFG